MFTKRLKRWYVIPLGIILLILFPFWLAYSAIFVRDEDIFNLEED
jgi:hypothetical protein